MQQSVIASSEIQAHSLIPDPADSGQLRIVIVGHVDHGKSTLIGRLLYDTHSLPEGKYQQINQACQRRGIAFEWAFLMDAFQSERDQNITIDTAQIWFRTAKGNYVIMDAPGHEEFIKNMVTGAASADAALLLIAANEGVQDQSRQHAYMLSLLGINQVVVLVNKMDLVGYDWSLFKRIEEDYRTFLERIDIQPRSFIPIAARHGGNVAVRSLEMPWYRGPTVVEALDHFQSPTPSFGFPLRFAVQDVYRFDNRRIVVGRVEAGELRVGDKLIFWPHNKVTTVNSIETWKAPKKHTARGGESLAITLKEQIFVERGHIASHLRETPAVTNRFRARLFWLGKAPLVAGKRYKLKLATQEVECDIARIEKVSSAITLERVSGHRDHIDRKEVAELVIRTKHAVALDDHSRIAEMGRFVIVDDNRVAGGGVTREIVYPDPEILEPADSRSQGDVTVDQRHYRHGHKGAVVWLTGPAETEMNAIARNLERLLFNRGMTVFMLDNATALDDLNSDLGFSPGDRAESVRRVGELARMFAEAGIIVISAFPSHYRSDRHRVRSIALKANCEFVEVFVDSAASGDYEKPRNSEIDISAENASLESGLAQIVDGLLQRVQLPPIDYAI